MGARKIFVGGGAKKGPQHKEKVAKRPLHGEKKLPHIEEFFDFPEGGGA